MPAPDRRDHRCAHTEHLHASDRARGKMAEPDRGQARHCAMPSMNRSRSLRRCARPRLRRCPSAENDRRCSSGQSRRPARGRRSGPASIRWAHLPAANASASVRSVSAISSALSREQLGACRDRTCGRRDDLEMGGVAHRPAQIGEPERAKPGQRIIGGAAASARIDLGAKAPLRLLGDRIHQGVAARKMPERRPRRHAGAARRLADADRFRARPRSTSAAPPRPARAADRHGDRARRGGRPAAFGRRRGYAAAGLAARRMRPPSITGS